MLCMLRAAAEFKSRSFARTRNYLLLTHEAPLPYYHPPDPPSDLRIMIQKVDIPRPLAIVRHKVRIPRRPLGFIIPRQHTLYTDTNTLHIMHRAPALGIQQIETDDAVAVDVGMEGYGSRGVGGGGEDDFGRFDGVGGREGEFEAVGFVGGVDGVVGYAEVHFPGPEVGGGDEGYAGCEAVLDLIVMSRTVRRARACGCVAYLA